jgi:hypothetical protein
MRRQSIVSAVASLKDTASKAGVEMTDEFLSAGRMILTRASGAVIEDEMENVQIEDQAPNSGVVDAMVAAILRTSGLG